MTKLKAIDSISSLKLVDATFAYEAGAPAIFENVTFELPVSRTTLISSLARQGRSTLLRLLAGLETPTSGQYLINGQDVSHMSFEEFLPVRKRIEFSFDFGGLMANRTLWQNLMLPLEYHRTMEPDAAGERVAEICRAFGLWEGRDARPAAVSGGSRKACAVARAFVMEPELLLLDDPFVALDAAAADAVVEFTRQGRANGTLKHVFFTAQNDKMAAKIGCDSVIELIDRKIRGDGADVLGTAGAGTGLALGRGRAS